MRALMARLPGESFVYLGDTPARLPYGTKSADTVRRYALQAAQALMARGVKAVVIACNTASVSLPDVALALAPLPVIGVIEPGAKAALAAAPEGPIAVIATEGTVRGGAYRAAIRALSSDVPIRAVRACPLFVALAEEGLIEGADRRTGRRCGAISSLRWRRCRNRNALLLGCTHYPVLKDAIARVAGHDIALVDSALTTADAVADACGGTWACACGGGTRRLKFLATDAPDHGFARAGRDLPRPGRSIRAMSN